MVSHLALMTAFGIAALGQRFAIPMVSHNRHAIERMGANDVRGDNLVYLMVTTSNSWVVPGNTNERRFAIIKTGGAGKSAMGLSHLRSLRIDHA